ncbi:hypothetical protein F4780DRAFT_776062 [Xylariomycetidae sp. FL0641]|nr:hypothetical protein F4780DRAFT_776062 [Xylariomycetidae sp. FL0641]
MPIKWDEKADRDLLVAMFLAVPGGKIGRPTISWDDAVDAMKSFGYDTNKSSITQRWQKKLLHELRKDHPGLFDDSEGGPATPTARPKAKASGTKASGGKRTRVKSSATVAPEDDHDDDADAETPTKKIKKDPSGAQDQAEV